MVKCPSHTHAVAARTQTLQLHLSANRGWAGVPRDRGGARLVQRQHDVRPARRWSVRASPSAAPHFVVTFGKRERTPDEKAAFEAQLDKLMERAPTRRRELTDDVGARARRNRARISRAAPCRMGLTETAGGRDVQRRPE